LAFRRRTRALAVRIEAPVAARGPRRRGRRSPPRTARTPRGDRRPALRGRAARARLRTPAARSPDSPRTGPGRPRGRGTIGIPGRRRAAMHRAGWPRPRPAARTRWRAP
jgi:hypothetical protein